MLSSFSIEMLHEYLFLFVGMTLLYLVGVCDDLAHGVGYRYKFIVQVVSALLLVLSGNWLDAPLRSARDLFGPGLAGCASHGFRRGLCDKRYQPD